MKVDISVGTITCNINYAIHDTGDQSLPHVLLLHGMSSQLEELDDVMAALDGGANVYRLDLPGCGQSGNPQVDEIVFAFDGPSSLEYFLAVINEFVLQKVSPMLGSQKLRVAGGSLGGNLSLLIACKGYSWLRDAIAWSPGSSWLGNAYVALGLGPARSNSLKDFNQEDFLRGRFAERIAVGIFPPQPHYWWSQDWGGGPRDRRPFLRWDGDQAFDNTGYRELMTEKKAKAIEASLASAAARPFSNDAAQLHWRVAYDQLAYSHRQIVTNGGVHAPRIAWAKKDILFMAGTRDSEEPVPLHTETRRTYEEAVNFRVHDDVRFAWEEVENAGHSLHNEVPFVIADRLVAASVAG